MERLLATRSVGSHRHGPSADILRLNILAAGTVCAVYVAVLVITAWTWSVWTPQSLARLPLLFVIAGGFGSLMAGQRRERRRAAAADARARRAEETLRHKTEQLRAESEVGTILARLGHELTSTTDAAVTLERLCQLTARALQSDSSQLFVWQPAQDAFVPVAAHGVTREERELARVLHVPRAQIAPILARLERADIVESQGLATRILPTEWQRQLGQATHLVMALRRGTQILGLLVAGWRGSAPPTSFKRRRVARGIAPLASLALANSQLIEEVDSATRLKTDFVASVSHELRTPLNLIIGYNDLLLDEVFGPLAGPQADTLRRVSRSSRDLLHLIDATLDLNRLDRQRVPLDVRAVPVTALLRELDIETGHWRDNPALDFAWDLPAGEPTLHTDATKLKLVLKNLIGNAIKFTPRGRITVAARVRDGGLEVAVCDTGIGIAPEARAIIFEPFRQADASIGRDYGGVGLGLYLARRVVDLLGGTIGVESEPGRGSTFRIWLPADVRCAPLRHAA